MAPLAQRNDILPAAIIFQHVQMVNRQHVTVGHIVNVAAVFAPPARHLFDSDGNLPPLGGIIIGGVNNKIREVGHGGGNVVAHSYSAVGG